MGNKKQVMGRARRPLKRGRGVIPPGRTMSSRRKDSVKDQRYMVKKGKGRG